jgi:hypothetical protein
MALSETQTFGFGDTVRELLEKARRALDAAGWDVDMVLSRLDGHRAKAVAANEEQEAAKRTQKAKTEGFVSAKRDLYLASSGYLDMAIAAVGKGTEEAKNLRRYRSRIRRPDGGSPVPLPVQLPPR